MMLAACQGSWNQDPLAGKSDLLNKTKAPAPPVGAPKPQRSDAVLVDVNADTFYFQEGKSGEIAISSRVLLSDYVGTMEIQNMGDFPGAKFDAAAGKFLWTPPVGTVDDAVAKFELDVFVTANPTAASKVSTVYSNERRIRIEVSKEFSEPAILKSASPVSIREDANETFSVIVSDVDGGTDPKDYPRLFIFPPTGKSRSLAPFLSIVDTKPTANAKEWEFKLRLDLRGTELVNGVKDFGFGLQAVSRFDKYSKLTQYSTRVLNRPVEPVNTWQTTEFEAEVESTVNFLVMDTRSETKLSLGNTAGMPTGASLTCAGLDPSTLNCAVKWKPDANLAGKMGTLSATIVSMNKDFQDSFSISSYLSLTYKVKPKATIPPLPPPGGAQ